ncbi:hypothetical protein MMA231_00385 [Asticcacaulis sp. MM231]|uniref:hypothetical protein n=1 Tax=Asticcacaulis sp. MM231 TaxID=3157666 RepID=UPI0032D574E1
MKAKRPYKPHTNHELKLMLAGTKPFAAFSYREGEDEAFYLGDQPFKRHVKNGQLMRYDWVCTQQGVELHFVLFALPGEEWRFKAYELMWRLSEQCDWNDTLERMEGTLLGYTDEQNEWHIANRDHYELHRN